MGFKMKVEGPETIDLVEDTIETVTFKTDIPHNSNARSSDLGTTIIVKGKVLTAVDGDPFNMTMGLGQWSLVKSDAPDAVRKVTIEHIALGIVIRKYTFPEAFVVDFYEDYADTDGIGRFTLMIRQVKDLVANATVEGGYGV